jgi:hypothetical protein
MEKSERKKELENVYQDLAYLLEKHSYFYNLIKNEYPALILEHLDTNKKYEIIIKEVK